MERNISLLWLDTEIFLFAGVDWTIPGKCQYFHSCVPEKALCIWKTPWKFCTSMHILYALSVPWTDRCVVSVYTHTSIYVVPIPSCRCAVTVHGWTCVTFMPVFCLGNLESRANIDQKENGNEKAALALLLCFKLPMFHLAVCVFSFLCF